LKIIFLFLFSARVIPFRTQGIVS